MGNHRADRRDTTSVRTTARAAGGRRKATRRSSIPKHPLTGLPLLPAVAGSVAVAVAAGGVLSGQASAVDETVVSTAKLNRLSAVAIAPALNDRAVAISRDADRLEAEQEVEQKVAADIAEKASARTDRLVSLSRSADRQAKLLKLNRWHIPVDPSDYRLTAHFGQYGLWSSMHTGLDFAGPTGTEIDAVANGTITEVGWAGAYGNRTIQTLDDGTEIWYCHQSAVNVSVGDVVRGGEAIGRIGSTGHTTGPHLHLEVRPGGGDPIDPFTALVYHGLHP